MLMGSKNHASYLTLCYHGSTRQSCILPASNAVLGNGFCVYWMCINCIAPGVKEKPSSSSVRSNSSSLCILSRFFVVNLSLNLTSFIVQDLETMSEEVARLSRSNAADA